MTTKWTREVPFGEKTLHVTMWARSSEDFEVSIDRSEPYKITVPKDQEASRFIAEIDGTPIILKSSHVSKTFSKYYISIGGTDDYILQQETLVSRLLPGLSVCILISLLIASCYVSGIPSIIANSIYDNIYNLTAFESRIITFFIILVIISAPIIFITHKLTQLLRKQTNQRQQTE